jgi:hypothetical protein
MTARGWVFSGVFLMLMPADRYQAHIIYGDLKLCSIIKCDFDSRFTAQKGRNGSTRQLVLECESGLKPTRFWGLRNALRGPGPLNPIKSFDIIHMM